MFKQIMNINITQYKSSALFHLRKVSTITDKTAEKIISLWKKLPQGLREAKVNYNPRYRPDVAQRGRFQQKKPSHTQTITPGIVSLRRYNSTGFLTFISCQKPYVKSIKKSYPKTSTQPEAWHKIWHAITIGSLYQFRAMVGGNSGPATTVSSNPIVEELCKKLESAIHSPKKIDGRSVSRWRLILDAYHHIRDLVTLNDKIMSETNIQLYEINQSTLLKWYATVM